MNQLWIEGVTTCCNGLLMMRKHYAKWILTADEEDFSKVNKPHIMRNTILKFKQCLECMKLPIT
jgi:hypothetical protein